MSRTFRYLMNSDTKSKSGHIQRSHVLHEFVRACVVLLIIIPLMILILASLRRHFDLTTNTLFLLVLTVGISIKSSLWLAIAGAVENFLFLNFLFTPPLRTFSIGNKNDLISLLAFIFFSVLASIVVNRLKVRTRTLQQISEEGLFLSQLASDIIRGHNSIDEILQNSKSTFEISEIAVVSRFPSITEEEFQVIHGSIQSLTPESIDSAVKLNPRYSLVANPPIVEVGLRNLFTTFGAQILILLERQILEENERELSDFRRLDQMRSALLTAVSHDLRGPLASSKAAISSLMTTEINWSDSDRQELLDTANHSLNQLNSLIENLLDMSRLEGSAISLHWGSVDVEDAISGAIKALKSHGIKVSIRLENSLPAINADPILLERVLVNVMENSLRFSPQDQPIEIEAASVDDYVVIKVIDHGPGIALKNRGKMFVPFQRLGDRDNTTGVGLGLAIVKGFTELMNGLVKVDETPAGGLTMILSFEVVKDDAREMRDLA